MSVAQYPNPYLIGDDADEGDDIGDGSASTDPASLDARQSSNAKPIPPTGDATLVAVALATLVLTSAATAATALARRRKRS